MKVGGRTMRSGLIPASDARRPLYSSHRMTRQRRLALITGGLLLTIGLLVLASSRLLSGSYHRAAIERLASRVAGQPIIIKGPIKIALLPDPQLIAQRVTIGTPHHASVRAKSLKLDLAPGALLFGRLRATRLTLRHPVITMPWPLPGGAHALAPPPWLASLHATIDEGTITIGGLRVTHANLSIFTGGPNAVLAIGGTARLGATLVHLTLDLSNAAAAHASLTAAISLIGADGSSSAAINFVGQFNDRSQLAGQLTGRSTIPLPGWKPHLTLLRANLRVTPPLISLTHLIIVHGPGQITGSASFTPQQTTLDLTLQKLNLAPLWRFGIGARGATPINLALTMHQARLNFLALPDLTSQIRLTRHHADILALHAAIGGGMLELAGHARLHGAALGRFTGPISLNIPHLAAAIAAWRQAEPDLPAMIATAPWSQAPLSLSGQLIARAGNFRLAALKGVIGTGPDLSRFTGAISHRRTHTAIGLNFDQLALNLGDFHDVAPQGAASFSKHQINLRLTAATLHLTGLRARITGQNLLIDAAIGSSLTLRAAGLTMAGTSVNAHGAFNLAQGVRHAQISMAGTNIATLIGAFDPAFAKQWPRGPLTHQAFALAVRAAGPLIALDTHTRLDLGAGRTSLTLHADQRINNLAHSAQGSLTLQAPSAIAVLGGLGLKAGLDWPGAGSIGLRLADHVSRQRVTIDNAVLSFGASTLRARLALGLTPDLAIKGRIHADRLSLPAASVLLAGARIMLGDQATLHVTARAVAQANQRIASAFTGTLSTMPGATPRLSLAIAAQPALGGHLTTQATVQVPPHQPPQLRGSLTLRGAPIAALAKLAPQIGVRLPLSGGTANLVTALAATGANQTDWIRDATGSFAVTLHQTHLSGLDLAAAAAALRASRTPLHRISRFTAADRLRRALIFGATPVDTAQIAANLTAHHVTLDHAGFTGPTGIIGLHGVIDRATERLDLHAAITLTDHQKPTLPPLGERILGTAAAPWHHAKLGRAMRWIDAPIKSP